MEAGRASDSAARTAAALLALVTLLVIAALAVPRVRSDGLAYYLWLEALVRDHTLNLQPATERHGALVTYQAGQRGGAGPYVSLFPFGTALLWAPFYGIALGLDPLLGPHPLDAASRAASGDTWRHVLAVAAATCFYVFAAVLLTHALCRRYTSPFLAAAAALLTFLGTPLVYYATRDPSFSHGPASFVTALLLWLAVTAQRPRRWALAGVALGLAATVRWQLALLGLPLAVWARRHGGRALLALTLPAAVLAALVPLSWLRMFGSPLPSALGTVATWQPGSALLWVLAAPVHGLFTWSPITLLAALGLAFLFLDPTTRAVAAGLVFAIASQVYMSAVTIDPLAGWCFGMRRLSEMYPAFAIGLAACFEHARRQSRRHLAAVIVAAILAVAPSVLALLSYEAGLVHPGHGTIAQALAPWRPAALPETLDAVRRIGWFDLGVRDLSSLSPAPDRR